ncbi:MAG: hypothetical protein U0031_02885 [Thermomicrobiales bacterium]
MTDRERASNVTNAENSAESEPRQPPTLSEAEVAAITEELAVESLMEEPPQGSLSIISDDDVPGEPG